MLALFGAMVPPLGMASALVAIVFSGVGWRRAHSRGSTNPVARFCFLGCLALVALVIVGNAIYARG